MLTKTNVLQITQEAWVCLSSASQRRDESSSLHVGYIPSSCSPQRSRTHLLPCWTLCSHALPTYYTRNCSVLTDKPSASTYILLFLHFLLYLASKPSVMNMLTLVIRICCNKWESHLSIKGNGVSL